MIPYVKGLIKHKWKTKISLIYIIKVKQMHN